MKNETSGPARLEGIGAVVLTASVLALIFARPADAYIDAGTGGLLVQLLLAGIAGAGVILKMYWRKLTGFFARREK